MIKPNRRAENLLIGIAEIIIGILLLIDPIGFTSGIIIALGAVFACLGVFSLINYFRTAPDIASEKHGLTKGLLYTALGLFCMLRSEWFIITFPLLTVLYGILTLAAGIGKIQWAVDMLRTKQKYWFVAVIGAALTIIFAILILTNPFSSTAILWTFIAVTLIVESVVDIIAYILGGK